ncbi:MAG: hypothetical protein Q7R43_02110 [Candidatus Daviesbacteria bacterium]|nr:hypothetical protein [Candidatus Daviesbacteria bacterium]
MTGKQFLIVLIFTFITVVSWVSIDIFKSREAVAPPPEIQQLLEPINPNFNTGNLK